MIRQNTAKVRLLFPDLLRILATFFIITYHFQIRYTINYSEYPAHPFPTFYLFGMHYGILGVSMFMLLSGVSLWYRYRDSLHPGSFYKKRILTLMIPFYIAYAGFFPLFYLTGHMTIGSPAAFLLTLIGMDGLLSRYVQTWYLLGEWFLGMILIYYLCFPLIRLLMKRIPVLFFTLSCIVTGYLAVISSGVESPYEFNIWIPVYLPVFLLGILTVEGYLFLKRLEEQKRKLLLYAEACSSILLCILSCLTNRRLEGLPSDVLLTMIFTFGAALFIASLSELFLQKLPQAVTGAVTALSKITWCICLTHHVTIQILMRVVPVTALSDLAYTALYFAFLLLVILEASVLHAVSSYLTRRLFRI